MKKYRVLYWFNSIITEKVMTEDKLEEFAKTHKIVSMEEVERSIFDRC